MSNFISYLQFFLKSFFDTPEGRLRQKYLEHRSKAITGKMSDKELIVMIRAGSRLREEAIMHLQQDNIGFANKMFTIFRGLGKEKIAELYAEALIVVDNHIYNGKFKEKSKISVYLYRIFKNKCIDAIRPKIARETKQIGYEKELEEVKTIIEGQALNDDIVLENLADPESTPEEKLIYHQILEAIETILSEEERNILMAKAEGYSNQEILEMFKEYHLRNANNVGSYIYKVRKKLKRHLK